MGAAAIATGGLALGGAGLSAYEAGESGKAQAGYYNYLSDTARLNAGLAMAEGEAEKSNISTQENEEQIRLTNRINETVGTQKAAVVSGVGASSRSAQDIIGDTLSKGDLDEMALRLNADMRYKSADIGARMAALNYNTQAGGYKIAGMNARATAKMQQTSSLIGGAGSVANSWFMGDIYAGRGAKG